jgi:hypothetical protein
MPETRVPGRKDIEAQLAQRHAYVSMLKTRFTLPHLIGLYRFFGGDMAMPIVLGEIAMRNFQAVFQMRHDEPYDVLDSKVERKLVERTYTSEHLRPANALSISIATGIPRETVRRRVDKLIAMGWVQRDGHSHLFITRKLADDMGDFDREETTRFALAAGAVMKLVEEHDAQR